MAETVGSLCDKLSIMVLKEYHMREQAQRTDITVDFLTECVHKLSVIKGQRRDLETELDTLLFDIRMGVKAPKVYRQVKTYNDPRFRSP